MALLQISEPGQAPDPHQRRIAVGIDLGTTHSLVAAVRNGVAECLPDDKGRVLLPSAVRYLEGDRRQIGFDAAAARAQDPANTITSVKRLMGRGLADIANRDAMSYRIGGDDGGMVKVHTSAGEKSPVEISAEILATLRFRAEDTFDDELYGAVITVPAYFDEGQRQATKDAAQLAGLNVLRLISEPTAAAIAYGLDNASEGVYAVYDLGGGTFDISILRLTQGVFEVIATGGDSALGGDDYDHALAGLVLAQTGLHADSDADKAALLVAARAAKEALTDSESTAFRAVVAGAAASLELTREQFYTATQSLTDRTIAAVRKALRDAKLKPDDLKGIVLVGGSTRMPLVRRCVQELFGKTPHSHLNPDEVVALGAAVQADILSGGIQDMLLLDVTPLSLGIETMGGVMSTLIRRNTTIPASAKEMFTTYVDGQTSVDIHILQGERELAKDNRSLARFQLKMPPLPAGVPRIEVTFLIDANGILNVTAQDVRTAQIQSIQVKPSYGLSDNEVERMIRESFQFAAEDLRARQLIEARTEADAILTATEKAMQQGQGLISTQETAAIRSSLAALEAARAQPDHKAIRARIAEVEKTTHHLAEVLMDHSLKEALENKKLSELT